MRGCVLTGVWGAGKTTVYQRVVERLVADGCQALIAFPQAATITTHTYAPGDDHEHATGMRSWLDRLAGFLEDVDGRWAASTLAGHRFAPQWHPTCLLEGLGFDIPVYDLPVARSSLLCVERRLAALGLSLVLLRIPSDRILDVCLNDTRQHRSPKWTHFVEGFGADDAARAQHIDTVQNRLLEWVDTSPIPLHVIDSADQDWDQLAGRVLELITA